MFQNGHISLNSGLILTINLCKYMLGFMLHQRWTSIFAQLNGNGGITKSLLILEYLQRYTLAEAKGDIKIIHSL